jgi:hypothetical protein
LTGSIELLAPWAAVAAPVVLIPAAAVVMQGRRARRVLRALGLHARGAGSRVATAALTATGVALLIVAAARPARVHSRPGEVRTDAELYVVLDTSGSMAARAAPSSPTRFARAQAFAVAFRRALPTIPSGVASFTDRTLPHLLPSSDVATFDATVREAVGIERPPPRRAYRVATTYSALADLLRGGSLAPGARLRLFVLVTDGESAPYHPAGVVDRLRRARVSVLVVRVWNARERIYEHGVVAGYRPDAGSTPAFDQLGALAVGGRVFGVREPNAAAEAARAYFGSGPTARGPGGRKVEPLTQWFALAALVPLAFVVTRGGGAGRRFTLRARPRVPTGRA